MELRERLAIQLAIYTDETDRTQALLIAGKSHPSRLDFAEGVRRGLEIAIAEEALHRANKSEVVNG